jgi:hypothetical protein
MIIVTCVSWRWPPVGGNNLAWRRIKGRYDRFRKHEMAARANDWRAKERCPIAESADLQNQAFRKTRLSAKTRLAKPRAACWIPSAATCRHRAD